MNFFQQINIFLAWIKFQSLILGNTRKVVDEKADYRKPKGKRCLLNLNSFRSQAKGKYSTGRKLQSLAVLKLLNFFEGSFNNGDKCKRPNLI